MTFHYALPDRDRDLQRGCATLTANGVFRQDEPDGRRLLQLDLHLAGHVFPHVSKHDLRRAPRIPSVTFEVRPDLPCCFIGRNVWQDWVAAYSAGPGRVIAHPPGAPRSLPSYDEAPFRLGPYGVTRCHGTMAVRRILIALGSRCFTWGLRVPLLWACIGNALPPDICCVGRDLFQHGLVCWESGYTYLFPPESQQETAMARVLFHQPRPTPL